MGVGWNERLLGERKEVPSADPSNMTVQLLPFPPPTFFHLYHSAAGVVNTFCDMSTFESLVKTTDPFLETWI